MKYFISFKWIEKDSRCGEIEGSGYTIVELDRPVTSWEDLQEITAKIKLQRDRIHNVIILNWKRMELPE